MEVAFNAVDKQSCLATIRNSKGGTALTRNNILPEWLMLQ